MSHVVHTIDLYFKGLAHGIASFLVEGDEGPVIVETGPHSTFPKLRHGVEALGYAIEDIKHVFISHIHLDHAGAAWCFAELGAKVYLHPFGYRHMHDPSKLLASAKMIYKDEMDSLWGTLKPIDAKNLQIVEDGEIVTIGNLQFKSHHTPGHAKHHIAWQLDNEIFTGDVAGVCILDGPVIPPCPPPDIHFGDWLDSIDKLLTLENIDAYYVTHFGRYENLQKHMAKLVKTIETYRDFIEPHARSGKSNDEVIPLFKSFVEDYFVECGLDRQTAIAYESANPSDMSVGGIMRYWKKRMERTESQS